MRSYLQRNHRLLFYSSWLILTIVQSRFTELLDDEAYYWVYSKFLDWGYFDHPPMIALLIKIGYGIFHNELGVRLILVLMNLFSLLIIEKLIDRKDDFLFYTIVLSLAALQLSGFVAVPDTPLIFFTALFFLVYKNFLGKANWKNILLLGLVTAALMYSKYHSVLILFFVLLSNPKLFLRYQTYIAGVIALILFVPHLWWQYQHDWISFRYQLFESNVNRYKFSFTLDYIFGQILLAGPFAGIILLPATVLYRTTNALERALKFTLIGFYLFFLLSSFRGKVEANWTSPVMVPLIILSHNFLLEKLSWRKLLVRIFPVTLVLVLFARIVMIEDILPIKALRERYHGWRVWPQQMKKITQDLPVVFNNSYQRASKYWFYTGQETFSLNLFHERRNNYDFWPIEDSFLGKKVWLLDIHNLDSFTNKTITAIDTVGYKYEPAWASFAKVQFNADKTSYSLNENETLTIKITPNLSKEYYNYIMSHPGMDIRMAAGFFDKYGWIKDEKINFTLWELINGTHELQFNPHLPRGKYFMLISILHVGTITPSFNSKRIPFEVK